MSTRSEFIKTSRSDGVGWIVLDRPPLNIITIDMCRGISAALTELDMDNETRVIVLAAEGERAFAAGAEMKEHSLDAIEELLHVMGAMLRQLQAPDGKPRIAVVKGICSGGGNEVASFCDILIAREDARFSQPEIFIGGAGNVGGMMMSRIISKRKALELVLTGDWIDAAEALRLGLVNQVFAKAGFDQAVDEYLKKFTSKSMAALRVGRHQLIRTYDQSFNQAMDVLDETFTGEVFKMEDYREGVAAFLEKRAPVWKHR